MKKQTKSLFSLSTLVTPLTEKQLQQVKGGLTNSLASLHDVQMTPIRALRG